MTFTRIKNTTKYVAIKELSESGYSVSALCKLAEITRAAYYKWKNRKNMLMKYYQQKQHFRHPSESFYPQTFSGIQFRSSRCLLIHTRMKQKSSS